MLQLHKCNSSFWLERKRPLKLYEKGGAFMQPYLFPHSGLVGHAFHWHAVPLLSKSRKQRFELLQ